jgi:hypothetical protein
MALNQVAYLVSRVSGVRLSGFSFWGSGLPLRCRECLETQEDLDGAVQVPGGSRLVWPLQRPELHVDSI